MADKLNVTSVNYNYDFENGVLDTISVNFDCELDEVNTGTSNFSGIVQLTVEEAMKYSVKDLNKSVIEHVMERFEGIANPEDETDSDKDIEETDKY